MLFVPPSIPFMVPEAEASGSLSFEIVDKPADSKYYAGESLTIQGHWDNPSSGQCQIWVSLSVYQSGGSWQSCTNSIPIYVMSWNINDNEGTESRSTAWYTTTQADGNGDFSITLDVSQIAEDGFGHYMIRAEPSVNEIFDHEDIWFESGTHPPITDTTPADTASPEFSFVAPPQNGGGWPQEIYPNWMQFGNSTLTVDATNSTGQNAYFAVYADGENASWTDTTCSASPEPTYTTRDHYTGPKLEDDPSYWWKYGATFPIGTTTVTCTATDDDGNTGTATLTVNVILEEDTTPPVITITSYNIPLTTSSATGAYTTLHYEDGEIEFASDPVTTVATYWDLSAFDDVDGLVSPTCSILGAQFTSIYGDADEVVQFPMGTTTVTCTATDSAGNPGTASFTVTVTLEGAADTTPPVFTFVAPPQNGGGWNGQQQGDSTLTIQATNSTGQNVYLAIETEGGLSDKICSSATGVELGQTTWGGGTTTAYDWWRYGATFPIGTTIITCTATDAAGNIGTTTLTIIVNPSFDISLTITVPPDFTAYATNSTGQSYHPWYHAMVNNPLYSGINSSVNSCDGSSQSWLAFYSLPVCDSNGNFISFQHEGETVGGVSCSPAHNTLLPIGLNTITCTAIDPAGNVGIASFTVTVILPDPTPPVVNVPADMTITITTGTYAVVDLSTLGITATDDVGMSPSWSPTLGGCEPTGSHYQIGTTTVTCTATDDAGNQGNASFTVTVILQDTTPPEEEIVIPSWIKNNAGWWANGQIDDRAFVSGLQWLISNGIMNIPPTEQGAGSDDVIPSWIKNNAGWWADDLIDDRNFVTGLQWLITNGIMVIS